MSLFAVGCGGHGQSGHADAGGDTSATAGREGGAMTDVRPTTDHPPDEPTSSDAAACGSPDGGGAQKANGQSCTCASECASNFCVDGFCCNESCSSGCRTCALTGSEGTCVARTSGSSARLASDCAVSSASTCGLDGKCDGAGACRKYPLGTMCQGGTCEGAAVTGALICDGAGHCGRGPTMICEPFSCDPTVGDCYSKCTSNSQCVGTHACDSSGRCGKVLNGSKCATNDDCLSGFCANNVCCSVACQGPCVSCALPSREGSCWPIDADLPDPNGLCTDKGPASCGTNGKCDGVGGCARYPVDTQCAAPVCSGTRLNTAATCDGLGTCRAPGLTNCSPFLCTAGACTITCKVDNDCDVGIACVNGTCGPKQNGQSCSTASECKSGQCVDGVCCENACTGACRSCALPSSPGKCLPVGAGNADPRSVCKDAGATTCGQNGKCDGSGGCQFYSKTTTCVGETCGSNVYTPVSTCDGAGRCVTPASLPCSPFGCNGSKCFVACTTDSQCVTPNRCTNNSCGLANNGASCSTNAQCKSNFCAQGYCCDKACNGACQSCALSGTLGTCTNVATGSADPSGMCKDQGAASCGTNGKCQAGACQKYASGTSCADPTCPSGTPTFTANSTCDGSGKCVKPTSRSCAPYLCGSSACKAACSANADCASPAICMNGSCGLKVNGTVCADGSECKSGFCRQGVCCATECNSTCKSCNASASAAGTCSNVAVGKSDPAGTCKDTGAATCGTNGVCDGNGACQRYAAGTTCASATCPAGTSTQTNTRMCDGAGTCKPATTLACAPFLCNGTTSCNSACKADSDCLSPDICDLKTNLCGMYRRQGQTCSSSSPCVQGLSCVDGVCCASASCPMCQACNIVGSPGSCANVPLGTTEPHNLCKASPPCGFTGACNGAGACQNADTTTVCANATCIGSTFTPAAQCNGTGACSAAGSSDCNGYVCGANGACKSSCTADSDCVAPLTCQGSGTKSCTLKANGIACTDKKQCSSGNCVDGVCCGASSCGACNACNVGGNEGSCAAMGAGSSDTRCGATAPCGVTNVCDGTGSCRSSTATCAAAMCTGPATSPSFLPAVACSGTSTSCPSATAQPCGNYACSSAGCNTSCTTDAQCASGSYCSGGKCTNTGQIGNGCSANNQCSSGHCVDGVCCQQASCGMCQSCNVGDSAGACADVPEGTPEPLCEKSPPCGNTGLCTDKGTCAKAVAGTVCGNASCTNNTETSAVTCNGAGACGSPVVRACDPLVCGAQACLATCAIDADCISGDYCDTSTGECRTKSKPGEPCTSNAQCGGLVCGAEQVCCNSVCNGTCESCKLDVAPGTCTPLDPGTACGATSCTGNVYTGDQCDGTGGCVHVDGLDCGAMTCDPAKTCI